MAGTNVFSPLDFPWEVLDQSPGFSLDIGGSVVKVTYIDKHDWVEPDKRVKDSKGRLRFASFSREQLNDAFELIKSQAHILRKSPEEEIDIFSTGIGGSQLTGTIKNNLNVSNKNLAEFDCFVYAFVYLMKSLTRKDIIHEPYMPAYEVTKTRLQKFKAMFENIKATTSMDLGSDGVTEYLFPDESNEMWDKPITEEKNIFPCLLTMIGSGVGSILVKEDGSFVMVDFSNRAGRMFLGQGALMTDITDYDELMALCEKGAARGVNTTTVHLSEGIQADKKDIYQSMTDLDEIPVFCFGQAVGKGRANFRKEDIMRGLLQTLCLDIVQMNHLVAHLCKVKHVFFCGSFVQHHLVREELTWEWLKRDSGAATANPLTKGNQVNCHFLKQGSHLGSLGAFLNSKFNFAQVPPESTDAQPTSI